MISFVHLSDIHFTRFSNDNYDIDKELRQELLMDMKNNFVEIVSNPQGLLICGDVAYSGQKKEYDTARSFISQICEIANIQPSSVFCVPGNHDIDQKIPSLHPVVKVLQDYLANSSNQDLYDENLAKVFRSEISSEILYLPIANYNEFAGEYYCCIGKKECQWKHSVKINEYYDLVIIGLNSTIISNSDDHASKSERLMRMGLMQIPNREQGKINLTLCHHPPKCWNDNQGVLVSALNNKVSLQLYGHMHEQGIEQQNNSLIIYSGATHPSRLEESWIPRYNWLSLDVVEENSKAFLKVIVYPRIYSKEKNKFVAEFSDNIYREYLVEIDKDIVKNKTIKTTEEVYSKFEKNNSSVEWKKRFAYDFMNLPIVERNDLIKKYKLLHGVNNSRTHIEQLPIIIRSIEDKNCIEQIISEIKLRK